MGGGAPEIKARIDAKEFELRTRKDTINRNSVARRMPPGTQLVGSLDDLVSKYAPKLAGSPYGETSIRNLLRMSSGVQFTEVYDGKDDLTRFSILRNREGSIEAFQRSI